MLRKVSKAVDNNRVTAYYILEEDRGESGFKQIVGIYY